MILKRPTRKLRSPLFADEELACMCVGNYPASGSRPLTRNVLRFIVKEMNFSLGKGMDPAVMGMEDRDWYREKRIDWDRGGLKESHARHRLPKYAWWLLAAVLLMIAAALFRSL